jgi:Family of unknown function (DUF6328)
VTSFASPADRGEARDEQDERDEASQDARQESVAQRADRNFAELTQEIRVVGLGVQVLFGFLLSLPFTMRFTKLSSGQRDLYLTSLVLAAVATMLLIAPVAYHRMVFRQGMKEQLVRFANALAILGLAAVGGAVLIGVLLVMDFVVGALAAGLITAVLACMIAALWFVVPLTQRRDRR